MDKWINNLGSSLISLMNKKSTINILKILLVVWVLFVFLLYSYYQGYFYIIFKISWPVFLVVLVMCFIFGNVKVDKNLFQNLVRKIFKKDEINIKFKSLFFIVPFMAVIFSNIFLLYLFLRILFQDINFSYHIFDYTNQTTSDIGPFYHSKIPFLIIVLIISGTYLLWKKLNLNKCLKFIYEISQALSKQKKCSLLISTLIVLTLLITIPSILVLINPSSQLAQLLTQHDVLFYEITIFQRIFTTYLFYCLFILLVYALGRKILRLFKYKLESGLERFIFSIGVGLAPLMLGFFLVAVLGWLYAWVVWGVVLIVIIFSFGEIKKIFSELGSAYLKLSFQTPWLSFKSLALTVLCLLLLINFIYAFRPGPDDFDSLHTYFNAPNIYAENHAYRPFMFFSSANMAQNMEMIYAAILSIFNSAYIVHFSLLFLILFIISTYCLTKKLFGDQYATLAMIVLYFIPWNFAYIYQGKVEYTLAFYSLLMLYTVWLWYKSGSTKYLYLLGMLAGLGMGIKYNAALLIIPLFVVVFILQIIKSKKLSKPILTSLLSGVLMLLFFSPWAIKNQLFFKNIFYPYSITKTTNTQNQIINYDDDYITQRNQEIVSLAYSLDNNHELGIINFVTTIWQKSIGQHYQHTFTNFGIGLLILFPLGLLLIRNKKIFLSIGIIIIYLALWFSSSLVQPWYAFFGIMMCYMVLPYIFLQCKKILYIYVILIVVIGVYFMRIPSINIYYLFNIIDKETYLSNIVYHYNTAKFLNQLTLGPQEKILMAGDPRVAYIKDNNQRVIIDYYYGIVGSYLNHDGEEYLIQNFKELGIKYVVCGIERYKIYEMWALRQGMNRYTYLENYQGQIPSLFEDIDRLNSFLNKYGQAVRGDENYVVYKLNI